jgi:outer membrane protein TolC
LETATQLKEQDVTAAKADYQPNISSFFIYNGANSYRYASYSSDWEWHWSVGAALQWNLWDGALTAGTVRQKRLELDKMRTDLEEFRKAVRLEIKQAYLDMMYARQSVEAGEGTVDMAKKALEIAGTRYEAGLATYLEYTDANLALRTAELALNRAGRDHLNALARLEYAVGEELLKRAPETVR